MIGLGTLAKLKKGGIGPDELGELFSALGVHANITPIPASEALPAFEGLGEAALAPGAVLHAMQITMKNGDTMKCLMVMEAAQSVKTLPKGENLPLTPLLLSA